MFLGGVKADPVALIVETARGEFFFRQPVEVQLSARNGRETLIAAIWMKPVSSTVKVCALVVIAFLRLF